MKKRIVVKIGSHLIASGGRDFITSVARQLKELKDRGCEFIIVSSGAIVTGVENLGLRRQLKSITEKQAYAAIGQPLLMQKYIEEFMRFDIRVAQVLLTREDFDDRSRYLNIRNTLTHLLKMGVVPIVNENDTVATEEIKLGDNDTLSAILASKLDADMLVILTDVDGVYDKDPTRHPDAKVIREVEGIQKIEELSASKGVCKTGYFFGTGGLKTKLEAAKICCLSGLEVVIANGFKEEVLLKACSGEPVGTRFLPLTKGITLRKRWIAFGKKVKGKLVIDNGAVEAIKEKNKSLLPSGVKRVEGDFEEGDVVSICDITGKEVARGITNFSSEVIQKIKGKKTKEILGLFRDLKHEEVVHKDNLVVL